MAQVLKSKLNNAFKYTTTRKTKRRSFIQVFILFWNNQKYIRYSVFNFYDTKDYVTVLFKRVERSLP